MILKLIALKPQGYIKSRWNIFDGIVVIISLIDTLLTLTTVIDNTGTSVLRSFRLVRIFDIWSIVLYNKVTSYAARWNHSGIFGLECEVLLRRIIVFLFIP